MKVFIAPSKNTLVIYIEFHTVQFTKLKCWNNHHKKYRNLKYVPVL